MAKTVTLREDSDMLSVVVPAYNEQEMVALAGQTISDILAGEDIDHEIIFVDDGSADSTWKEIVDASEKNNSIRGVSFSRNFGKEAAILAGLRVSRGDCCAVIDCDLQHPPEKIVEMYRLWQEGYEVVEGVKSDRGSESAFRKFCASAFYKLMGGVMKTGMENSSDFKLLDRKVVDTLLSMGERKTFFRALSHWVGYNTAQVEFEVRERAAGESKWSFKSLTGYAVSNLTSFSTAPIEFITAAGAVMFIFSIIYGLVSLCRKLFGHADIGSASTVFSVFFVGSVIVICLGTIGHYVARIYEEVKGRPRYIISKSCGDAVNDKKTIR